MSQERGLRLPRNTALSDEDREHATDSWDTFTAVQEELATQGFMVATAPPPFPAPEVSAEQLTTDLNKNYTTLYAQQLAWLNYTGPILAAVKAKLLQANNALRDVEEKVRKQQREKNKHLAREDRLSKEDIEGVIWSDPTYRPILLEKQRLEQAKSMLDAYVESLGNSMRVISRQVEIRRLELEGGARGDTMPNRGKYPKV